MNNNHRTHPPKSFTLVCRSNTPAIALQLLISPPLIYQCIAIYSIGTRIVGCVSLFIAKLAYAKNSRISAPKGTFTPDVTKWSGREANDRADLYNSEWAHGLLVQVNPLETCTVLRQLWRALMGILIPRARERANKRMCRY
jgi:hypothetical protein